MRTTLDISDDVLFAAKAIAQRDKKSLGQVITELARRAFANPPTAGANPAQPAASNLASKRLAQHGITPLPARGGIVSNALIDRLRDTEGV